MQENTIHGLPNNSTWQKFIPRDIIAGAETALLKWGGPQWMLAIILT